ncbi:Pol polyprotein [Plakobranchus ocellatus]|uniref:Pol polyprotein n=1 Tax=Plakobranchus ocellatus TaxID=259542 RepID=A0AAV4BKD0_9GAST|nr:Pol polyprotein [Plakobranchus ocellatus]
MEPLLSEILYPALGRIDESIEEYVRSLYELAEHADFTGRFVESLEEEFSIDAAKVDDDTSKLWVVKLKIRETIVPFKINTFADITIINNRTFRQLMNNPKLKTPRISHTSPGGKLAVAGEFNATAHRECFQTKMTECLKGLEGCEAITDDTIVYGKTLEEHDIRLEAVLDRIEQSGLKIN